ncbi:hypothetical protein [Mesorhizobium sp. YM1C-6-2]|uniref:hypothetical protein n=1 Tax=Mesorhizobium sp. YM1C-6-2 TaxID=1827501 RepID=UPI000EF20023|nr:hypothetical protein [Mesorhizobium sp. YM1C-6-2]RLP26322.1 hypothetical protein D8676_11670 [Mesorhizobium sp. YM1C-6-2]
MSDELRPGETPASAPSGIFVHYCEREGSSAWGGWRYSRTKQETRWFCFGHRDHGERLLGR